MRWYELEAGDVLCVQVNDVPQYVVLRNANDRIKFLQLDEGVIFDYPSATAHVEVYGYYVTRKDERMT